MKVYHKTDVKNVESILKHGLRLEFSNCFKQSGGAIYLSTTPEMDMGLGEALFEVELDDSKLHGTGWQIISWENIPPERIKYLGKFGPNQIPNDLEPFRFKR